MRASDVHLAEGMVPYLRIRGDLKRVDAAPLTREDILNIIEAEKPLGVIVQFGGQTPLNLAVALRKAGVNILGTSADSIDIAEDRERFKKSLITRDWPRRRMAPGFR